MRRGISMAAVAGDVAAAPLLAQDTAPPGSMPPEAADGAWRLPDDG